MNLVSAIQKQKKKFIDRYKKDGFNIKVKAIMADSFNYNLLKKNEIYDVDGITVIESEELIQQTIRLETGEGVNCTFSTVGDVL